MFDGTVFEGLGFADAGLSELGAVQLATEARRMDQLAQWAQARKLAAVVALAELYERPVENLDATGERAIRVGSDGSPVIAEFVVPEVAGLVSMSEEAAEIWLGDALDARHRHPRMWEAVLDGRMRAYHAVDLAHQVSSAGLNYEQARWIDDRFAERMRSRGWTRSLRLVNGLIIACDPATAEERRQAKLNWRGVRFSPSCESNSIRYLEGALEMRDAIRLEATIERIADILGGPAPSERHFWKVGEPETEAYRKQGEADRLRDVNRSRALGILASPAHALALLQGAALEGVNHPDATSDLPFLGNSPVVIADPDVVSARPSAVLHVHVSDATLHAGKGVARVERLGAHTLQAVTDLLRGCKVIVRPVIDLNEVPSVDRYEIPDALRQLMLVRHVHQNAPFSNRTATGCDLDHVIPWDPDGPPGQTSPGNLVPISRRWHRWKTLGGLRVRLVRPGVQHWATPLGFHYLTTPDGTTFLGQTHELAEHPELLAQALDAA